MARESFYSFSSLDARANSMPVDAYSRFKIKIEINNDRNIIVSFESAIVRNRSLFKDFIDFSCVIHHKSFHSCPLAILGKKFVN